MFDFNWKRIIVLCTEMNLIDYELIQNCLTTNWYECLTVHWKKMFTVKCYVNEWNGKLNEQGTEMKVFKGMFDWNYWMTYTHALIIFEHNS